MPMPSASERAPEKEFVQQATDTVSTGTSVAVVFESERCFDQR